MFSYPFTLTNIRDSVPRNAGRHPSVYTCAYITTSIMLLAFVASTLGYLVPVALGKEDEKTAAVNLVFHIILPIIFFFIVVVTTRLWPLTIKAHLQSSQGFDGAPTKTLVNPFFL